MCLLGFKPRIESCIVCGERENLKYFSIRDNGVKCEECYRQDKSVISITPSTWAALKFIIQAPSKKIFSFTLKDESLKELELLSKIYFNEKLEKEYKLEELW